MVHLRIADNLLRRIPGLEPGPFAVGSIAPDSGVPDANWENFDPPPWITHFGVEGSPFHTLADLDFFRRFLQPIRPAGLAPASFRLGYFCHLLIDNLWGREIGGPAQERWVVQFASEREFIEAVKKDWYGLDYIYVRDHPRCLFWRVFQTVEAETGGLDFLPAEAVRQRVAYIQEYYRATGASVQELYARPFIYLSRARGDRFVRDAARRIYRIYQKVWVHGASVDGLASALDLPSD